MTFLIQNKFKNFYKDTQLAKAIFTNDIDTVKPDYFGIPDWQIAEARIPLDKVDDFCTEMEKAGLKTVKNELHKEAKGFYDAKERHFELYKDFQQVCIYQGQARVWELTEGGEVSKGKSYRSFNNE